MGREILVQPELKFLRDRQLVYGFALKQAFSRERVYLDGARSEFNKPRLRSHETPTAEHLAEHVCRMLKPFLGHSP